MKTYEILECDNRDIDDPDTIETGKFIKISDSDSNKKIFKNLQKCMILNPLLKTFKDYSIKKYYNGSIGIYYKNESVFYLKCID